MRELITAITEVYPELPLPESGEHSGGKPFKVPVLAWFGNEDVLLMLIAGESGFILAEPELCWNHPNIPTWGAVPRFPIPEAWLQSSMTPEQRETLITQARSIGENRLRKYGRCVLCKELLMPEHLNDYEDDGRLFCADCGNRHLGVIH